MNKFNSLLNVIYLFNIRQGRCQKFVAHPTIQLFLKSLWLGSVNRRKSFELLNVLSYAFPPIAPFLLA